MISKKNLLLRLRELEKHVDKISEALKDYSGIYSCLRCYGYYKQSTKKMYSNLCEVCSMNKEEEIVAERCLKRMGRSLNENH